jgi:hypothetical protein
VLHHESVALAHVLETGVNEFGGDKLVHSQTEKEPQVRQIEIDGDHARLVRLVRARARLMHNHGCV